MGSEESSFDLWGSVPIVLATVVVMLLVSFIIQKVSPKEDASKAPKRRRGGAVDGKAKENIVDMAISKKREKVFMAAPDLKTVDPSKVKKFPKSSADKNIIVRALRHNFVFAHLQDKDINDLVIYFEPTNVQADTQVITQGEEGDYFYVVNEGSFEVLADGKPVGTLASGSSFGELALVYNSPRKATITAETDCQLWRLDRDTFRNVLAKAHDSNSSNILEVLKTNKIMQQLSDSDVSKLADMGVEVEYSKGQVIVKKGDEGTLAYFVMEGKVRVTDLPGGVPDVELGPGEQFGEVALMEGQKREATVIAETDAKLAAFSTEDTVNTLGPMKEGVQRNQELRKLKSIPLFREFSDEMIESLLSAMTTKTFKKGEKIIHQGDVGTTFYLIADGQCDVVITDEEGKSSVVKTLSEMSYFGEMALLADAPRTADVIATSECKVNEVEQSTFKRMFGTSDNFLRQMQNVVQGRENTLKLIQSPVEKIKMDQLDTIKILGAGTFGRVSLVEDQKNGLHYALKAMSIEFIEHHKQELNIVGEKKAMLACEHPFILKLYATFKDSLRVYMLLEFCNGGELFNVLHTPDHDCIPEPQAKFYAACELLALEHLAMKSMAYRDLKPENTLVDSDGYLKMIDMGFAKVIKGKSYTFCGTPEYLAPEIILSSGHNRAVDIFALGVLIYEMICGQTPFFDYTHDSIFRNIVRGKVRYPAKMGESAKALIQKLLIPDPAKRLGMLKGGMTDIIKDEWFKEIKFDELIEKKVPAPWKPTMKEKDPDVPEEDPIDESYESNAFWLDDF